MDFRDCSAHTRLKKQAISRSPVGMNGYISEGYVVAALVERVWRPGRPPLQRAMKLSATTVYPAILVSRRPPFIMAVKKALAGR